MLLIFLFLGFILQGTWSIARVFVSIFGLAACVMVAVGFKAKWSASFLVLVLSVFNVFANNWWTVGSGHPQRDFLKYAFFLLLGYPTDVIQIRLLPNTLYALPRPFFRATHSFFEQRLWAVSSSSSTWALVRRPHNRRRHRLTSPSSGGLSVDEKKKTY